MPTRAVAAYDERYEGVVLMARTVTKLVVTVEVAPSARPDGFVYVHDVQLEGDENLELGTRVEVQDEGGHFLAATVDDISTDKLGRRYRLRLGA